jgi:hypothetical protein
MNRASRHTQVTDRGAGLIEVLAAVTLLGLAGAGTLTAMTTAIRGSSTHEKLSGARRWVVSAADYVTSDNVARLACTSGEAAVRAYYQSAAQGVTNGRPDGWAASQITVQSPVLFWNGTTFGTVCYDTNGLDLQQITFVATNIGGSVDEVLTVVKGND